MLRLATVITDVRNIPNIQLQFRVKRGTFRVIWVVELFLTSRAENDKFKIISRSAAVEPGALNSNYIKSEFSFSKFIFGQDLRFPHLFSGALDCFSLSSVCSVSPNEDLEMGLKKKKLVGSVKTLR